MSLDVYHPKISYLVEKYKTYLIKIYDNIKENFINPKEKKIEKFSVVKDIIRYISNYNKKYGTKIEIINIIRGQKEENEIITNITKYLLDFMFDIGLEENNENEQDNNMEESHEYMKDYEDNDIIINSLEHEIDKDENEYFIFDDFFYNVTKIKKKEKNFY